MEVVRACYLIQACRTMLGSQRNRPRPESSSVDCLLLRHYSGSCPCRGSSCDCRFHGLFGFSKGDPIDQVWLAGVLCYLQRGSRALSPVSCFEAVRLVCSRGLNYSRLKYAQYTSRDGSLGTRFSSYDGDRLGAIFRARGRGR